MGGSAILTMLQEIDDTREQKDFKINKEKFSCRYTTSLAPPDDTAFKHQPIIGDVHLDESEGDFWVWRAAEKDTPSPRWIKHTGVHALLHPNSIPSHRYSWNTELHCWKRHNTNKAPTSDTVEGVKVSSINTSI